MASSKGNSNSNKTAHVMNLLRKNAPAKPAEPPKAVQEAPKPADVPSPAEAVPAAVTPQPSAPQPAAPAPAAQSAPPIITALNADKEISLQIRDALEDEVVKEEKAAEVQEEKQPSPKPEEKHSEPVAQKANADLDRKMSQEEIAAMLTSMKQEEEVPPEPPKQPEHKMSQDEIEAMLAGANKKEETPPEPPKQPEHKMSQDEIEAMLAAANKKEEAPQKPTQKPEPELHNVMQDLCEEKVDKYIQMFDVCTCPRCRKDVVALALNHLPAKYVVVEPCELMMRMDMYQNRYNCELTAQLMRACQIVKKTPHHR